MTPDGDMPADGEILRAVFAACDEVGGSPVDLLNGVAGIHARYYAGIALAHQYPAAPRRSLARKLGVASALTTARAEMTRRQASWFDLVTLNAVRRRCGWTAMTREEAADAPLTFCGRYEEFVAQSGDGLRPSPASSPLAGSGVENEPASNHTPTQEDETAPAAEVWTLVVGDGFGEPSSEKGFGADAGVVGLAAAIIQSSDGRAEGRALEGPTNLLKDSHDTGSRSDGQARSEGCGTPGLNRQVRVPATAVLKGRKAARTEDLSGDVAEPVVEPGPSDAARTNGAEKAGLSGRKSGFAKETKPVTVAPKDARRPSFGGVGCLGLTGAVDLNYRPDPPPEKRGVVVVTGDLMGDPTPEQRERMRATPGETPGRAYYGAGKR
jgi:hypothetical protein